MDELLKSLLNRLEVVGKEHTELYDTECRERMGDAVFDGFIRPREGFVVPSEYGLYSPDANARVRTAIYDYITAANSAAAALGLKSFHQRLSAFQNENVRSDIEGVYYDDVFGYCRPESFNELGESAE
jgi:hypothetical protein